MISVFELLFIILIFVCLGLVMIFGSPKAIYEYFADISKDSTVRENKI